LSYEGQELAECFPEPPLESKDRGRFADPEAAHRVSLSLEELVAWGEKCHLRAAGHKERQQLEEALKADDRRDCVSRAIELLEGQIPDVWEIAALKRLRARFAGLPRAVELGLPVVIDAIVVTEQFHEAVLGVFETLLWWGTQKASNPVSELLVDKDFHKSADRCRETAKKLLGFRERCERLDVRDAIEGLAGFSFQLDRCPSERELVTIVLDRHHRVQSGKLDGGMPKRDWIGCDSAVLLRPSPRFQRNDRPSLAVGKSLTHPYRLEQFVHMLRENGEIS